MMLMAQQVVPRNREASIKKQRGVNQQIKKQLDANTLPYIQSKRITKSRNTQNRANTQHESSFAVT